MTVPSTIILVSWLAKEKKKKKKKKKKKRGRGGRKKSGERADQHGRWQRCGSSRRGPYLLYCTVLGVCYGLRLASPFLP